MFELLKNFNFIYSLIKEVLNKNPNFNIEIFFYVLF
jgi:hypothetical protein